MPQLVDVMRASPDARKELEIRAFISSMDEKGKGPYSPLVILPRERGNLRAHWGDLFREEKRAYAEWVLS